MKKPVLLISQRIAKVSFRYLPGLALAIGSLLSSCDSSSTQQKDQASEKTTAGLKADPGNGDIQLPTDFGAIVVADTLGRARHMVVRENGDIYVSLREPKGGGSIVALRDTDNDGKANQIERFGQYPGTGIDIRNGYLYFAPDSAVFRYKLNGNDLKPAETFETIVSGLTSERQHAAKSIAFDGQGNLYVNIGAPSNACQEPDRQPGVKGQDPCPILEYAGGIWRFKADQPNQTQKDGQRYATGIRNAVAIDWNKNGNNLYALQHGRDMLNPFWPTLYTEEQSVELPSEEFMLVKEGANFGWPYCYNDHQQNKKVLNPEYGGDGKKIDRCEGMDKPIMAFPGHWAPNDVLFYTGNMFPEKYKNGAFIAFHGSWNRAPQPQAGYMVAFVPFNGDKPSGDYEIFAQGFTGTDTLRSPDNAKYRPMGLAQGPDGSLYIADSQKGRIWRVIYNGSGNNTAMHTNQTSEKIAVASK
jgi:glucose/arabinose dehydrogenase